MKLAPSILAADFSKLGQEVKKIETAGAELIHVDVMDGHFVPNISFGSTVMKSLISKTKVPFDVHLMIENPDDYIEDFCTDNTEYITIHQEAATHMHRTINHIKGLGIKAGVSLNPATPVSTLENILEEVDLVLIMSVNPGFGGQKFISSTLKKVEELRRIREANQDMDFKIEIDGGITLDNIKMVTDAGVDVVVAGSSVFGASSIEDRVKEFYALYK